MKKFFYNLRKRLAQMLCPKDCYVVSDNSLTMCIKDTGIENFKMGYNQGVSTGLTIVKDFMEALNGREPSDWCKRAYDYVCYKSENLVIEFEDATIEEGETVVSKIKADKPEDFD